LSDSTAETDAFAGMMAAHPLAQPEAQDRQRIIRRGIAAGAMVVVHLLILLLIVFGNQIPIVKRIKVTIPEAIQWIPVPAHRNTIHEQPPPQPESPTVPEVTAPITLPPVPRSTAKPQGPGTLEDVGKELGCGASSYEYLTPNEREQCKRHPWAYIKKSDGTLVLQAPPKPVEPPPSIADIMRHEQQTAPPCPMLQNTPCLGKIMHGDPLGGAPSPF